MYISVVTLYVDDVDRAVAFYQKLGWEKTMDVPMGKDSRWVTVAPPGERTSFTLHKAAAARPDRFSGVVLEVDDVYRTHERLQKLGVEFPEPPRIEPWGGWATFKDSEGNMLGVHSPARAGGSAG